MVGWHDRLDGHEFEQVLGVGDGQGSLAFCSPWGYKEMDITERLNWTKMINLLLYKYWMSVYIYICVYIYYVYVYIYTYDSQIYIYIYMVVKYISLLWKR